MTPQDSNPTALIAKLFRACKAQKRPMHVYTGHTAPWCILEGGGMAGKTTEESKWARLAHYDNIRKDKGKRISKVTFTPAGSSAFTLEGDPETIAAYLATKGLLTALAKQEFAGLASDNIPSAGALTTIEDLEIDV
ncbi:hypothetical protein C0995_009266 [Termitomyces sp. Mi166|nr:hypothetical protein C0995_009266 [Termitomyces sp. Mi166\